MKILLVEEVLGRLRILDRKLIEQEGGVEGGVVDCLAEAQAMLERAGDGPVALALPHYRALSQVLDLPTTKAEDVGGAIEEESATLSGLGESQIVYDFSRLAPFGRYQNPFWVTFCQEGEVQRHIGRCGLASLELCEVTTTANAMAAAYLAVRVSTSPVALIDVGASGTLVTVLIGGQPVYSASFALGCDVWAEVLAKAVGCSLDQAHRQLGEIGFQQPPATLVESVRRWQDELRRLLEEWLRDNPELRLEAEAFECVLAGGGAGLPGFENLIRQEAGLTFVSWPGGSTGEADQTERARFAVAYGTALHALRRTSHPVSLLPADVRLYWRRTHLFQRLHFGLFVVLMLLVVALGFGTWQKMGVLVEKKALHERGLVALSTVRSTLRLERTLEEGYNRLQPILQRQRETLDTLSTLAQLPAARSNRPVWFVLFATRRDYATAAPFPTTNAPSEVDPLPAMDWGAARGGFVVELCVIDSGEAGRRIVSQVAAHFRESGLFQNVDSLREDRRRPLADPAVLLPGGHFALELETPANPFGAVLSLGRPLADRLTPANRLAAVQRLSGVGVERSGNVASGPATQPAEEPAEEAVQKP